MSAIVIPILGRSARQLKPEFGQTRRDASIDDVVTDLYAQSADDRGVDDLVDPEVAVGGAEHRTQALGLRVGERRRGVDRRDGLAVLGRHDAGGGTEGFADAAAAGLLDELTRDGDGLFRRPAIEQALDESDLGVARGELAAESELELRVGGHGASEGEQL